MKPYSIHKLILLAGMLVWLNTEAKGIDMYIPNEDTDLKTNSNHISDYDSTLSHRNAEFGYFNLIEEGEKIVIRWQTLFENSAYEFSIEKSYDATGWESIGNVSATGISNQELDYEFIDIQPTSGISYYRIKETDVNGYVTYSKIKAIEFTGTTKIDIFPQPATHELNLNLSSFGGEEVYISIHSLRGKLINEWTTNTEQLKLNLDFLERGVYLINIQTSHYQGIQKLIKD